MDVLAWKLGALSPRRKLIKTIFEVKKIIVPVAKKGEPDHEDINSLSLR